MSRKIPHTGKTESLYIQNYLTSQKPPLLCCKTDDSDPLPITSYTVTDGILTTNIADSVRYAKLTEGSITVFFKMNGRAFQFSTIAKIQGNYLTTVLPVYFTATEQTTVEKESQQIIFRFGNFHGQSTITSGCTAVTHSTPELFSTEVNKLTQEWFAQSTAPIITSSIYTAYGKTVYIQPKLLATGFFLDQNILTIAPQKGETGTISLRIDSRSCPAHAVCLKATQKDNRYFGIFSITFFYPEDTRFFYEFFFKLPCPDSLIDAI